MARLAKLALNEDGFAFDPATGDSYTLNPTGLMVVRGLRDGRTAEDVTQTLAEEHDLAPEDAERDVDDFLHRLRVHGLI